MQTGMNTEKYYVFFNLFCDIFIFYALYIYAQSPVLKKYINTIFLYICYFKLFAVTLTLVRLNNNSTVKCQPNLTYLNLS